MDFDRFAEAYEHEVEEPTRFACLPTEFFLEVKVAHLLEKLKQQFEDLRQLRVLDVGCGVALVNQLLNAHLPHLVGVDFSRKSLGFARVRKPQIAYYHSVDDK